MVVAAEADWTDDRNHNKGRWYRMSRLTKRSIWFVSCVGFGLFLGYMDGFKLMALAKTGLIASLIFVVFLVGESLYLRLRQKNDQ